MQTDYEVYQPLDIVAIGALVLVAIASVFLLLNMNFANPTNLNRRDPHINEQLALMLNA